MTDELHEVKTDENGCPIMDGFAKIYLASAATHEYSYEDHMLNIYDWGVDVKHEKDGWVVTYPWHTIHRIVQNPNSEDYVMAIQLFRESCNHVWDEKHAPIAAFCQHVCIICGEHGNPHATTSDPNAE